MSNYIYGLVAHYTNELLFYSKTLKPTLEMYKIITEYVNKKKSEEINLSKRHDHIRVRRLEDGSTSLHFGLE